MTDRHVLRNQNEPPEDVASLYSWANMHGAKYKDFSGVRAQTREKARLRMEQLLKEEKQHRAVEALKTKQQAESVHDIEDAKPGSETLFVAPAETQMEVQTDAAAPDEKQRFAWLSEPPAAPQAASVREPAGSRWLLLQDMLKAAPAIACEPACVAASATARMPVLAVFSLAGGVGKTSLTATLGRTLAAQGERVLLVDTAAYGLLPFYFGAEDQRPGQVRTFMPPATGFDTPIQLVMFDPERMEPQETLSEAITVAARDASRVIIDLATASGATMRRVLRMVPTVLVPLTPEMNSVASVQAIESFFRHQESVAGNPIRPYYVLNQFDASLPLHVDVRTMLREQLGDRLLDFVIRRTPALSEALAEGMTVVDYAPHSVAVEDFGNLAAWVKVQSVPVNQRFRGARWSER
jgi:cellulose biosynthesis protein BcsQ